MNKIIALLVVVLGFSSQVHAEKKVTIYSLNYDEMILLDAENLAEQGIMDAYEKIKPTLKEYIKEPAPIEEISDNDVPSYSVFYQKRVFHIYGSSLPENQNQSWGRAAYALFSIVNDQIKGKDIKFYAINAGHDLGGMFLTSEQARLARNSLPQKRDWPYIPTQKHPWYGQENN